MIGAVIDCIKGRNVMILVAGIKKQKKVKIIVIDIKNGKNGILLKIQVEYKDAVIDVMKGRQVMVLRCN
jgi:hypothetical protein